MFLIVAICLYNCDISTSAESILNIQPERSLLFSKHQQRPLPSYDSMNDSKENSPKDQKLFPNNQNVTFPNNYHITIPDEPRPKFYYYEEPYDIQMPEREDPRKCIKLVCSTVIGLTFFIVLGYIIFSHHQN